jgi:hypothetical protein
MEILFAVLVLALLIIGLLNRKKEKKEWLKEERFEESGDWLDKRSGERGTYGSLDEEMEANRAYIAKKGKVSELAQNIQGLLFAQSNDFQTLSDERIKQHLSFCKSEITVFFDQIEAWTSGKQSPTLSPEVPELALQPEIKKLVLDFVFERFPKLLDLEIEQIKQVDQSAGHLAHRIRYEVAKLGV